MRSARALWLGLWLGGCGGGQLAELESEQADLRAEYEALEANVQSLKRELVELGVVTEAQANAAAPKRAPKGKAKAKAGKTAGQPPKKAARGLGHPKPAIERSADLPWTATRSGKADSLPELPTPTRTEGACGWVLKMPGLAPLSDFPLNRDGFGKSGPLLLLEDGTPLQPHAESEAFRDSCAGAYRHAGFTFLFSPTGTVEAGDQRTYSVVPAPDFPLPRGDDQRPMYWIYPGTTATFAFDGAWPEDWGDPELAIAGRAVDGTGLVSLTAPGIEEGLGVGTFGMSLPLDTSGPLQIELSSPPGGPWLLVDTLTVGNANNAVVITANAAWDGP